MLDASLPLVERRVVFVAGAVFAGETALELMYYAAVSLLVPGAVAVLAGETA